MQTDKELTRSEFERQSSSAVGNNIIVVVLMSLIAVAVIPCIVLCYQMIKYRSRRGLAKQKGTAFQLASDAGLAHGGPGVYRPDLLIDDDDEGGPSSHTLAASSKISHTSLHNPSLLQWNVK
jgi:hypothetical protein